METFRQPKEVKELLIVGRDFAAQLQALLRDLGPSQAQDLSDKILGLFDGAISLVTATTPSSPSDSGQIPANSGDRSCVDSGESGKRPAANERRGGCKRRRNSDSWIQVSTTMEDGYAWRKYGQKVILKAEYPRCYYRCTHKPDQGCLARKQVQVIAKGPQKYQTTYFGNHTCSNTTLNPSNFILDSYPKNANIISFEPRNCNPTPIEKINPPVEEEIFRDLTDDIGLAYWSDNLLGDNVMTEVCSSGGSTYSHGDLGANYFLECHDFENTFSS